MEEKNEKTLLENVKFSLELIKKRIKNKEELEKKVLLKDSVSYRLLGISDLLNEFNKSTNNFLVNYYSQIRLDEFKATIDKNISSNLSINYDDIVNIYEKYLLPLDSIIDELIIIEKSEIARKEMNRIKDVSFTYRLTDENKAKLKELEIFKNKVPFQIRNGWFNLVYNLGKDITEVCKLANCELPRICEVKSKYSSLRFDYYFESDVKVPKIVEKLIDSLIYETEDRSERICELCGSNGEYDVEEDGSLVLQGCEKCKKEESNKLNKVKSFYSAGISKRNWYADEILERMTHIRESVNKKEIDVNKYLDLLDGTLKLIDKIKISVDRDEFVDFNADDFTSNEFEKYGNQKRFSKSVIIRKYLSTMNKQDIHTLCEKFGKDRVIKELNYKFREMFELGYIDIKGLIIRLSGDYKEYGVFLETLEIVESYKK